jgi:hypothetical protein
MKILKSLEKLIHFGVCTKEAIYFVGEKTYQNNLTVGLNLANCCIYGPKMKKIPAINVKAKSIFKVLVDMNYKRVSWYIDE